MRLDLVRNAAAAARLPEVLAERCVHGLIEQASCRRCVDACPTGAWVIDDERLGIDPARCDGCGLCAPACPQAAIVGAVEPLRVGQSSGRHAGGAASGGSAAPGAIQPRGLEAAPTGLRNAPLSGRNAPPGAMLACERAWVDASGPGVVPCVHALGLRDLARLAAAGCRSLVVATGDCDDCPRGAADRVGARLADLARLLDSRGLPLLRLEWLDADSWQGGRAAAVPDAGPAMGRRSFLRRGLGLAVEEASTAFGLGAAEQAGLATAAQLLPSVEAPRALVPVAPAIDGAACTGCDACARLCPQGAIRLEAGEGTLAYRLEPVRCTGCGICVDVCADRAVQLGEWLPAAPASVPLGEAVCSSCRVTFHRPARAAGLALVRCPICERRGGPDRPDRSLRIQE